MCVLAQRHRKEIFSELKKGRKIEDFSRMKRRVVISGRVHLLNA